MIVSYAEIILRVISAQFSLSSSHLSGCHFSSIFLYLDFLEAMVALSGRSRIFPAAVISSNLLIFS